MKTRITHCLLLLWALALAPETVQARYLNPGTGRFQTMDSYEGSIQDPPSLHKYLHVSCDPVNASDPTGEFVLLDFEAASAGQSYLRTKDAQNSVPKISLAKKAVALITAAAVGAATIEGPKGIPYAMRLQLQEGSSLVGGKHYWSSTMTALAYPGVRKSQVWNALLTMWSDMKADRRRDPKWDKFPFQRWNADLRSAVIRMSQWVREHGPTPPYPDPLLHQEYLDPSDEDAPRIDLENLRGENLRQ